MKRSLYTFSILQYSHDAWIGEFLNIGVMISCPDERFLQLKVRSASSRISHAYPGLNASDFRHTVYAMRNMVTSIANRHSRPDLFSEFPTAIDAAHQIIIADDSSLQWRDGGAGFSEDLEAELEYLFDRYVGRWDQPSSRQARTDEEVYSTFHRKLRATTPQITLEEKVVRTPRFGSLKFKHTYQNGSLHIVQPLSLDAANADNLFDKAAKWRGKLSRLQDNKDVVPYLITGRPQDHSLLDAYHGALELLKDSVGHPRVVEEEASDMVAHKLASVAH